MSKIKGGAEVVRQNFSMHPNLIKVFIDTANHLNTERAELIIADRSKRVTYSKVAAAFVWHIQSTLLAPSNELTEAMRNLMADYEASTYESTDPPPAEAIQRRTRHAQPLPIATTSPMEEIEDDDES